MPPLNYLHTYGPHANEITALTWGMIFISILVTAVIIVLLMVGIHRKRVRRGATSAEIPVQEGKSGTNWITVGGSVSTLVLVGTVVWTVTVLASVSQPPRAPTITIDVTGEQWWWAVRYENEDSHRVFNTANEIHIPVGEPVLVRLHSTDVIHSFWVPALAGKTDTIPGQTNVTWLQADKPGHFQGQCTEFCGLQHAHMGLMVIADTSADFAAWWNLQLQPVKPIANGPIAAGARQFDYRCGACHTVRGTESKGAVAPDLTHVMSRETIAAVTLPNTADNLSAWITSPQKIKPGTRMPDLGLTDSELTDIRAFLISLK